MIALIDPTLWAGLVTLIVLEIVLGIDNVLFIAILAEKLPESQRDKARIIGLSLALVMRILLLSLMSWLVTLTRPLFHISSFSFSGRDLILLAGGLFLLFKATTELHERLEAYVPEQQQQRGQARFWAVIAQIVVLDAVFSLDAVITAVGMVDSLWVMITAVVISMIIMLFASKPLMRFVNKHATVVVLCLSFLLMIGLSLLAEGLGFYIPKGYLYAAIGFSILIECFNQLARRNLLKYQAKRPLRERTAEAILKLMGEKHSQRTAVSQELDHIMPSDEESFAEEERYMINGVLTLASRSIHSVMTPRADIIWVDISQPATAIRQQLLACSHSLFPVCRGELDELLGVMRAKDLLIALEQQQNLQQVAEKSPALVVPETTNVINLLTQLRQAKGSLVIVTNEFGEIEGIVTPLDVLEAIAGEFPNEGEEPDITADGEGWLVKGKTDLHTLEQVLNLRGLVSKEGEYASLAGMLLAVCGQLPEKGEIIEHDDIRYQVMAIADYRIEQVRVEKLPPAPLIEA